MIVQVPVAAREPPAKLRPSAPAVAVTVPPQLVVVAGVAATTTFTGNVSLNDRFVSALAPTAVFAMVTVRVEVPPTEIGLGENALLMVTFGAATVSVALAAVVVVAP